MIDEIKIRQLLKNNELKITPQRHAVLNALFEMRNHPTVDEIYQKTQDFIPAISLASVYNALTKFVDCGIVNVIKSAKGVDRYDIVERKHHHLHCKETGEIKDYIDDDLEDLIKEYFDKKKIKDFEIEDVKVQIFGQFK